MKKYFTSREYKNRQRILRARQERREEASRNSLPAYYSGGHVHGPDHHRSTGKNGRSGFWEGRDLIAVPEDFQIKGNCEAMLTLFSMVYASVRNRRPIFLDMSRVRSISADAILYMLSAFEFYQKVHGYTMIGGNYPNDLTCRRLLVESGFLDYVTPRHSIERKGGGVLSIKSDVHVQPSIAAEVVRFAETKLGGSSRKGSRRIYETLIECMANTRHHAYLKSVTIPKWWLIALPTDDERRVRFSFLDNGAGIPATVRKNFPEMVNNIWGKNEGQGGLIYSALMGEFRTRTGKRWRGKGLPTIHEFAKKGDIADLSVVSGNGFVDVAGSERVHMPRKFYGTLLSWDFV